MVTTRTSPQSKHISSTEKERKTEEWISYADGGFRPIEPTASMHKTQLRDEAEKLLTATQTTTAE
ncbi:hypothetical protein RP20_CCG028504 [Aedes albopictus]|nr:hypothetical protein RP20_CCG028504 [Aedes albopictus]